jgi:hypothetical protein
MRNNLIARLAQLAAQSATISYGDLARELAIPGPGAIAKLTTELEILMQEDAQAGRPFRAALCKGRLANGLPAQGFFDKAQALGRYQGQDPAEFVAFERQLLRNNFAQK